MASNTSDFILPLGNSQDEDTSDEVIEVMPELQVANKRGCPAKAKSTNASNEITTTKSQAKQSWVWDYFIKKCTEKVENDDCSQLWIWAFCNRKKGNCQKKIF